MNLIQSFKICGVAGASEMYKCSEEPRKYRKKREGCGNWLHVKAKIRRGGATYSAPPLPIFFIPSTQDCMSGRSSRVGQNTHLKYGDSECLYCKI